MIRRFRLPDRAYTWAMKIFQLLRMGLVGGALVSLSACMSLPATPWGQGSADGNPRNGKAVSPATLASIEKANDVVLFALGLMETGYRFGGKNPSAGLDCSGMVTYVFEHAAAVKLRGSAADIAKLGRPVDVAQLRPGDLVFFNTRNKSYSHVGIYIGEDRFIHSPSEKGKVRTDRLKSGWFATRFEEARTYFE